MADLKFTTTLIQLKFFSLHRKISVAEKKKQKTAVLLAGEGALAGTAKLVLDIITQKNDAR